MAQTVEQLAYELSLAAIAQQDSRDRELRARTGTLLAAAAVAFGVRFAGSGTFDPAAVLALLAYGCALAVGLIVLLPHRLVLEFRGSTLLDAARAAGASLDESHEAAAQWIERYYEENRAVLERLERCYTASVISVGVEIVLLATSVSGSLL